MICGVQTKILVFSTLDIKKSIFKQREFEKRCPGRWWRNKRKGALQIQTTHLRIINKREKKNNFCHLQITVFGGLSAKEACSSRYSVGRKHAMSVHWRLLTVFSVCVCALSHSVMPASLWPYGLQTTASSVHRIILARILE